MDLHPDVFWDLSMSELQVKAEGYFLRIDREWEHTRFLGSYLHSKLEGKITTPEKLMPLIFDEDRPELNQKEVKKITKQDVKDFEEKWLRVNKDDPE